MENLIKETNNEIIIISGEGELGTLETFSGARTLRAIKSRLKRERCGGQRWAKAKILVSAGVYANVETGEFC